jgi:hypothetical protein
VRLDFKKRCQIFGVLLIYLTVVSAHIFYLPRITSASAYTYNSVFKRKIENIQSVNSLERTDKAVFKENVKSPVSALPLTYLNVTFAKPEEGNLHARSLLLKARSLHNQRYSYLSFCIFRI